MTNKDIHDLAAKAYERFGSNHKIGYSVRWETGEWKNEHPEHDVAGYMSKRDALKLGALIAKDGRRGVRVYGEYNINTPNKSYSMDACKVFSEDSPELSRVADNAVGNELRSEWRWKEPRLTTRKQIVRGLDGRKLGTVIRSATKREVFILDGQEITRERATEIAMEVYRNGGTFLQAIAFRDCGTADKPSVSKYGALYREYRPIEA